MNWISFQNASSIEFSSTRYDFLLLKDGTITVFNLLNLMKAVDSFDLLTEETQEFEY